MCATVPKSAHQARYTAALIRAFDSNYDHQAANDAYFNVFYEVGAISYFTTGGVSMYVTDLQCSGADVFFLPVQQ